jgi:acetyl esterase/lipase/acyl-coenzyme A synthetase/AMP-(fatty) acid ligase/acyl carrier protein
MDEGVGFVLDQAVRTRDVDDGTLAGSVVDAFESLVDADRERDAIRRIEGETRASISFGQLDGWADAIASELVFRRGSKAEAVPLAICEPELMLAAALGVLKAGKFYVAVNPTHSESHVRHVLDELDARLLLCDVQGRRALRYRTQALSVEEIVRARCSDGRLGLRFEEARLAYVLYTSGSTGRPRGVAQSRRDMLHNIARHRPLGVRHDDCVTLLSADGFVASISNPYVALLSGAALAPYSFRDAGVDPMMDWLGAAGVSVLYAFPSFLRQLARSETTRAHNGLRLAYLGGETVLPSDLAAARRLFPGATLSVGLNSSETGLTCLHVIPRGSVLPNPVPTGRPVLDVDVVIVDESGRSLAPGECGEIEIRSEYVRPRYWDRGSLGRHVLPAPAFRTGDRGRIDADGVVYHLGRIDGMVKIRGFRVELAGVEAVISALDGVAEVAVFALENLTGVELAACVVGYGRSVNEVDVRNAVARELPAAMIPTRVSIVDALPRTPNGKLNRKGLIGLLGTSTRSAPRGFTKADGSSQPSPRPEEGGPRILLERRIAEIWCSVLGIEQVDLNDDFFSLGGTSITAVAIVASVCSEFEVRVPLSVLFKSPNVAALAAAVVERGGERGLGENNVAQRVVRELIALQEPLRRMPLVDRRRQYEDAERAFAGETARGEMIDAGGCAAEWVVARRDLSQPVVVYFHGGGYSLGSARTHRHLAASIGCAAEAAVLAIDYRRAPEFAFPAAVEDAVAATRWLLGSSHAPVVLAGDSAGGGLVVASMTALRDAGQRLPVAGICLSPWVDLTCTADAYVRLAERDPLLSPGELRRMADAYLRDADPRHPLASPVFAELAGLPPILIQVGTEEILLDDARRLASAARAQGVEVTLEEWPEMGHAWQWYFPVLQDGRRAIGAIGAFIRQHTTSTRRSEADADLTETPAPAPACAIQEAHLRIVPSTVGRGFLNWVYQLNGEIDAQALSGAVDEVVSRHEVLRVRFVRHDGRTHQIVTPLKPGVLELIDFSDYTKRDGLDAAIADVERIYRSLSPSTDPRFRAILYTISRKTAVLAMFVAEALVDSDSGALLCAELTRAYATRVGASPPPGLPPVSDVSYLDHVRLHPADQVAVARAREHWVGQTVLPQMLGGWPMTPSNAGGTGSNFTFELTPAEWALVIARSHALRTTPYVFVLSCLQLALARVAGVGRFLAHAVVSARADAPAGMIGNFHSLARIDMRLDGDTGFECAIARTAAAVAEAIEHSVLPAPLAAPDTSVAAETSVAPETSVALRADGSLPGIRFYMFANHGGPAFPRVRRRRFRLHGVPCAPLSVSCIYAPNGRQDFVFSSSTATQDLLESLARTVQAVIDVATDGSGMTSAINGSAL